LTEVHSDAEARLGFKLSLKPGTDTCLHKAWFTPSRP